MLENVGCKFLKRRKDEINNCRRFFELERKVFDLFRIVIQLTRSVEKSVGGKKNIRLEPVTYFHWHEPRQTFPKANKNYWNKHSQYFQHIPKKKKREISNKFPLSKINKKKKNPRLSSRWTAIQTLQKSVTEIRKRNRWRPAINKFPVCARMICNWDEICTSINSY